jgi:hypothetical protein
MQFRNLELWAALAAIVLITVFYLGFVAVADVPAASGLVGHLLGIIGFVLMLMTEVLYSLRKRYQLARWGKLQYWLSFHIFTGLVGPYMVLLHSSWKFNGLAGILMLMTVIIVISGFIGRYFYTAVPRSVDGAALEREQIQQMLARNQQRLDSWREAQPDLVRQVEELFASEPKSRIGQFNPVSDQRRWQQLEEGLSGPNRALLEDLRQVWERQRILNRQLEGFAAARKLLAFWHTVHIPMGIAMFAVAFIHIGAALYYATLLR